MGDRGRKGNANVERLFDINDLSERFKVPAKTIRNKLSNGTWPVPPVRIGRALRWRQSDVDRFLAGLSPAASAPALTVSDTA